MCITDFKTGIMKTRTEIVLVVIISLCIGCVSNDDYDIPKNLGSQENQKLKNLLDSINKQNNNYTFIAINDLKQQFKANRKGFKIETNSVIKGYVTSSDKTGNFYKEFFVQNTTSNPTSGIRIALDQSDSYNQFNFGREVYIHLKNLYVGESNTGDGIISIGGKINLDGELESLSDTQIKASVLRSTTTNVLEPLRINPSEITNSQIGVLVQFEGVHFPEYLKGETYVNPNDKYDSQRFIVYCDGFNYENFVLETSTFASFRNQILPEGTGTITGVLSKTYDGSRTVLLLNNYLDVVLSPENPMCVPLDKEQYTTIFKEDFNTVKNKKDINLDGWVNHNEAGNLVWEGGVYKKDGYAYFTPFESENESNIAWLVTPPINIASVTKALLTFKTAYKTFPTESQLPLEVFISTNFDGTIAGIATAKWNPVTAKLAHPTNAAVREYVKSGFIDLSNYKNTVYIAFKYTGSGKNNLSATIRVEDVEVLGKN